MEALGKIWGAVSPYWLPLLLALLAVAAAVALVWWWRRRQAHAPSLEAPQPMRRGRLLQIRGHFLSGLPWLNRAAVLDLPTTVVLGPAGSGKTRLIDLDVDWQRQARQFLPSYTQDPLLQIYLGPDSVVQEVSAPLLTDDSPQARTALKRLWSACLSRQTRGLSVIVLDVRWLGDSPPDEVRRAAQLLRGKLNLMAEVCNGPVETRLCLTHMDGVEGFADFARMLRSYAVPLSFDLPQRGDEEHLATLLKAQEQYLALGLTSLPVDAFERLERFYSQGGRSFAALARFVTALLEGGTLSFKPQLSRLYLSSPAPEMRAAGVLAVPTEETSSRKLRERYLRKHLRRCATIAAVCCLPVLAAYGNFYRLLRTAEARMLELDQKVRTLKEQKVEISGSTVKEYVEQAGLALEELSDASRYWPPLEDSFPGQWAALSNKLSGFIRKTYLRPALTRCNETPKACRPEEVATLLAILHASYNEPLGKSILSLLPEQERSRLHRPLHPGSAAQAPDQAAAPESGAWLAAVDMDKELVRDYIENSDCPWGLTEQERHKLVTQRGYEWMEECILDEPQPDDAKWASWPHSKGLTDKELLEPWRSHLERLQTLLEDKSPDLSRHQELSNERNELQASLSECEVLSSLPRMLGLLDVSVAPMNSKKLPGIDATLRALQWEKDNQKALVAVLRMEEELQKGLAAVEKMTPAELLTQDGLWAPTEDGPFKIEVLQKTFEFRPRESSRQMLQALIDHYEQTGRMPFRTALAGASASLDGLPAPQGGAEGEPGQQGGAEQDVLPAMDRASFDREIKPLVDEFTQRLKNAELSPEAAAQRQEYVRKKVERFSQGYRAGLFLSTSGYHFLATPDTVSAELNKLTQPASPLVDMLREVTTRASLEPLEGPYYEPLRNAVSPFKPLLTLMTQDKNGNYTALAPYQALVAQLHDELNAAAKDSTARGGKGARDAKGAKDAEAAPEEETDGPAQLSELLSPLGQVALPMLLEQEGSYLRKVDAWLDQQGLIGELRQPFRQPFLTVRELGKEELEKVLAAQWSAAEAHMVGTMLKRYPFVAGVKEEVEPRELEVLRRKDGAFWQFVDRVVSPVCVERGTEWALRGPLRNRLRLPPRMLSTLSRMSRMARVLWDDQGKPRPLVLQVLPLPLPSPPEPGSFVTMASLKCGRTTAFGYNQSPAWQDFSLAWWEQQTASIVLELRAPQREKLQYRSLEEPRSSWSCFRLLEAATATDDQHRVWRLAERGAETNKQPLEISFGVKGEPWAPFREVRR